MRHVPRIYIAGATLMPGVSLSLEGDVRHRLANVHRIKQKQTIILFNGKEAAEASAEITGTTRKQVTLQIDTVKETQRESPLKTRLCQALEKSDRMDYAIQKAVELGVSSIQPMLTTHSLPAFKAERLAKKMAHWQGIVVHACEQSGRCVLPTLLEPVAFSDLLQQRDPQATGLIPDPDAKDILPDDDLINGEMIDILIGPIGGYTKDEIQMAVEHGLHSIRLGPRILRTETAGPVVLTILQSKFGDLN